VSMGMYLSIIGPLGPSHSCRPPIDHRSDEPPILLDQRPCARTPLEAITNPNSDLWVLGARPLVISCRSTGTTSTLC